MTETLSTYSISNGDAVCARYCMKAKRGRIAAIAESKEELVIKLARRYSSYTSWQQFLAVKKDKDEVEKPFTPPPSKRRKKEESSSSPSSPSGLVGVSSYVRLERECCLLIYLLLVSIVCILGRDARIHHNYQSCTHEPGM